MPPYNTLYQLKALRNLLVFFGVVVPTLVLASTQTQHALELVPTLAYVVTLITSTLGGVAGTLHRLSKHLEQGAESIKHPRIFLAANLLAGLVAGWLSFLMGTQSDMQPLLVQGAVLGASFMGAVIIERFVDRLFPVVTQAAAVPAKE